MEVVDTGFDNPELIAAAEKNKTPAPVELTPEEKRAAEIAEGQRQNARHASMPQHMQVREAPEQQIDPVTQAVESEAAKINRELMERIMKARNTPPAPPPVPPKPAPGIIERTRREMEEGQRMNQWHAEQRAAARRVQPTRAELQAQGGSVPVFQPPDMVPQMGTLLGRKLGMPGDLTDQERNVRGA